MTRTEEIEEVLDRLRALWLMHSEMRLGQLIENVTSNRHMGLRASVFYVSDSETIKNLDTIIEKGF